ncbi:RHS repeat-associated core domain-containing protein [Pseudomonas sp. SWRI179]|uniref:RHS repeat-associated core domain-containing protein n=1 Tax=Pseudomonas sp. SWRI179 TaxID=2745497 RepID=UPI001645928D|nr:RHS repeat-associated core domain-containing protein [Pseudomonas sp. SWRI179]MBC3383938.1 RHS repeat-associated core domain-containing protein [Pseudomonas sp. SWRI179]
MSANRKTLLCRYHYDPLDRLADCTPSAQARTQRFYLKERLTSEIQGSVQRSIFQQADQLLAQQQRQDDAVETTLLATDLQRSVLHALDATRPHPLAYTPYGHRPAENGLLSLLGFNGERPDPVTGHYLLGNGYRAFNPGLMRFNSPDSLSPFGKGGLNAYGYCVGDPVNRSDPTGHLPNFLMPVLRHLKIIGRPTLDVHGISLPASTDIKNIDIFKSPTKEFLISPIGPEHEISYISSFELKLWTDSNDIIKAEKFLARQLKNSNKPTSKIEDFHKNIQKTLKSRAVHKANLHMYETEIKQMTDDTFKPTSFYLTYLGGPPTYEWAKQHSQQIRNQI